MHSSFPVIQYEYYILPLDYSLIKFPSWSWYGTLNHYNYHTSWLFFFYEHPSNVVRETHCCWHWKSIFFMTKVARTALNLIIDYHKPRKLLIIWLWWFVLKWWRFGAPHDGFTYVLKPRFWYWMNFCLLFFCVLSQGQKFFDPYVP